MRTGSDGKWQSECPEPLSGVPAAGSGSISPVKAACDAILKVKAFGVVVSVQSPVPGTSVDVVDGGITVWFGGHRGNVSISEG